MQDGQTQNQLLLELWRSHLTFSCTTFSSKVSYTFLGHKVFSSRSWFKWSSFGHWFHCCRRGALYRQSGHGTGNGIWRPDCLQAQLLWEVSCHLQDRLWASARGGMRRKLQEEVFYWVQERGHSGKGGILLHTSCKELWQTGAWSLLNWVQIWMYYKVIEFKSFSARLCECTPLCVHASMSARLYECTR